MKEILFYCIIFFANIIQGITGFAGTILAMPFSISTVGYSVAKPVLNVLGILAGIYVVIGNYKKINYPILKKICIYMGIGIVIGICIKNFLKGQEKILYWILGLFVLGIGLKGLYQSILHKQKKNTQVHGTSALLLCAGVIHGMFVCGGPLVVSYLSDHTKDKEEFRRTVSAVWIVLNTMILFQDVVSGSYSGNTIRIQIFSIIFLFGGMFIGSLLYKHMSQKVFMTLTYILLCISGASLIF